MPPQKVRVDNFHVTKTQNLDLLRQFTEIGLEIVEIFEIENKWTRTRFHKCVDHYMALGKDPNIQELYHVSYRNIYSVCETGLDVRVCRTKFFGSALCFAKNLIQGTNFCEHRGKIGDLRVILQCSVILGKIKEYDPVSVLNTREGLTIVGRTNLLGQDIDESYKGRIIITYSDGSKGSVYIE